MKVPKLFKDRIRERRFRSKILRRIHIDSEREFILQLYRGPQQGLYSRVSELGEEQVKRLRQLASSIRKNRGVVRAGKLSLIALVVIALLVFNFFFKNRLLERGLERGLEAVFSARADVRELDFRILAGRLRFDGLSVADQRQPMRNLFELGAAVVDLNTAQLIRGKVVVSDLEAREIRWHTPRESSGALPGDSGQDQGAAAGGSGRRGFPLALGNLDAEALLEQQLARLDSPERIGELNRTLSGLQSRWQERVEDGREDVEELGRSIETVRAIDPESLDSAAEVQAAGAQIREAAEALAQVREELLDVQADMEADRLQIAAARSEFERAVEEDVDYLTSLSDLSSGELKSLVSDVVSEYLRQSLGRYYGYAQSARGYAGKLTGGRGRDGGRRSGRGGGRGRLRGEYVSFPTVNYPRFLLENAGVSLRDGDTSIQGSLQHLSSNPELTGRPVTFDFSKSEGQRRLAVEGGLDSRSAREWDLRLGLQAAGFAIRLEEGLEDLGLRSVSAGYRLRTDLIRSRDAGSAEGRGRLELYDLVLLPAAGQNPLGTALYETLGSLSTVDVAFEYTVAEGSLARVEAQSSVDEQLARALEERFGEIAAQYSERVREELDRRLAEELEENEALSREFSRLTERSDANLAELSDYEKVVARKRRELEEKASAEVRSQLESQLQDLQLPKLKF